MNLLALKRCKKFFKFISYVLKRAANFTALFFVTLFFITFSFFVLSFFDRGAALAATPGSWSEMKKWVEERLVEGEVEPAVEQLKKYIGSQKESASPAGRDLLNQVVNTFLMDETHKKFYQAQTLKFSEPDRAIEILAEVRRKEPFNEKAILEVAWILIHAGKCDQAGDNLNQALKNNPYSKRGRILKINALSCLKDWQGIKIESKEIRSALGANEFDSTAVQLLATKEEELAEGLIKKINRFYEKNQDFPLAIYWQVVALRRKAGSFKDLAQKYLSICQTQKAKVLSKYENYPLLCSEEAKVISYIKESN